MNVKILELLIDKQIPVFYRRSNWFNENTIFRDKENKLIYVSLQNYEMAFKYTEDNTYKVNLIRFNIKTAFQASDKMYRDYKQTNILMMLYKPLLLKIIKKFLEEELKCEIYQDILENIVINTYKKFDFNSELLLYNK